MARCLNLTRTGEYAVAALSRLTLLCPDGAPISVGRLAALQRIPKAFLSKILQRCARAGIIRAKKGASGGVSLARDPRAISLLAIVEACEGSYVREECVFFASRPCAGPACDVYCPLRREEEQLRESLGRTTLAAMARSLGVHPDLNAEPAAGL